MPVDFAALAGSISSVPGVRAALLLSREGLALAVAPESEESRLVSVWARLAGLGEVEKGFVNVDGGRWVVGRRGPGEPLTPGGGGARTKTWRWTRWSWPGNSEGSTRAESPRKSRERGAAAGR